MSLRQVDLRTHPLKGVSLIEASAGTGKTYTISHLYVRCLLETDFGVEQILVVTFTNAATQELKGRIRKLIVDVRGYLQAIAVEDSNLEQLFAVYRQDERALFKLQRALINFDEASIYSIHGFCQRVLTRFPVETLSMLQPQIIPDEKDMQRAAIRDYWRQHIIDMQLQRLEWVLLNWPGPDELLRDAMPLFNIIDDEADYEQKPQSLDANLVRLWQQLVIEWNSNETDIKAVLIDNPALKQNMVQPKSVDKLFQQLDTLFTRDLPYELPLKWELITSEKLNHCLKAKCQDDRIGGSFFINAGEFLQLHQQWLRQQKIELLFDVASTVKQRIDTLKMHAFNISFDDLITQLSEVLKAPGNLLAHTITKEYPVAMVDEFQDTDYRQYFIFKTLYQQRTDKTLILIGDPKQAIYSFRGADVFTYQQAKANTADQFTLDTNYRSSKHYIDVVNRVFEFNDNAFVIRDLIQFHQAQYDKLKPKTLSEKGQPVEPLVSWIYPFSAKPVNKTMAHDYFARICAQEIGQILHQQTLHIEGQPVEAKDLAVLVKTGRQASMIKQRLFELGISSALVLRDSVFASEQAREICLLLEMLIEPSNIKRLNGLLSTNLFGWNAQQIFNLQQNNEQLVQLLEQMKACQLHWEQKGILSMFFLLLQQQNTLQKNSTHMDGERRITNWLHIMELLQQQSAEHASPGQALHWLRKQRQSVNETGDNEDHQLRLESDSNLVRIVTIHKSKGLEYPIVFLPFMWDVKGAKNQPKSYSVHDECGRKELFIYDETRRQRWHEENLAEEVRLFYVAMTRARYRCYLGWGNISGAGSSAVAQCLYKDRIKAGKYPLNLELKDAGALRLPFVSMNQGLQRVKIVEQEIDQEITVKTSSKQLKLTRALPFNRRVERQWRISSYSQIASSGYTDISDRPDYDALTTDQVFPDQDNQKASLDRFSFHKGARAGNFLHDLLEMQPFDQALDLELIRRKCQDYGFDQQWVPCLSEWIDEILNCQLNGLKLSQLRPQHKISEMEFYMSCNKLRPRALNDFLHRHQYSRPEQQVSFTDIRGFIKGFIDLVFEYNGQYFVADYKSNYLGAAKEDYRPVACNEAMLDHHYHLQYLIYTLALQRYLQQRIKNYEYEKHFGGVYYLFLRGMSANDKSHSGVFFHKPAVEVIQELNRMFEYD